MSKLFLIQFFQVIGENGAEGMIEYAHYQLVIVYIARQHYIRYMLLLDGILEILCPVPNSFPGL